MSDSAHPGSERDEPETDLDVEEEMAADEVDEPPTEHATVEHTDQLVEDVDRVQEEIAEHTTAGEQRASLREVAASLGISTAVALRALRGESEISDRLVGRVQEAAKQLHYPLEDVHREENRRGVVAILVNTMRNPWISDIVRSVRIELTATSRAAFVVPTRRRVPEVPIASDLEAIRAIKDLGVDGFIILSELADSEQVIDIIGDTPVVGASISSATAGSMDTVRIDEETGQGLIVSHLVSLGHTEIAHVGGVGSPLAKERADAFLKAMARHGLEDCARVEPADFTEQVGATAGSMLLRGSVAPSAITCANDPVAMGVLAAAADAGYEVPSQLAIAGYGNTTISSSDVTQLTSVDPNPSKLGAVAAQFLIDRIGGDAQPPRDILITPSLVARRSSSAGPRPEQRKRRRIMVD